MMNNKKSKKTTVNIAQIDTLLPFLRLIVRGCYHRHHFNELNIASTAYDECLRRLHFSVGSDYVVKNRHDGGDVFHVFGDSAHGSDNYFLPLLKLKSFTRTDLLLIRILIMQILSASNEALSTAELYEKLNGFFIMLDVDQKEDDYGIFMRQIKLLSTATCVDTSKRGNKQWHKIIDNPLKELTDEELYLTARSLEILQFSSFYSSRVLFLREKLLSRSTKYRNIPTVFRFLNYYPARIFDEAHADILINSIKNKFPILYKYDIKNNESSGWPIQIETDFLYNRQYLVVIGKKKRLTKRRLDLLRKVKRDNTNVLQVFPSRIETHKKKEYWIKLKLYNTLRPISDITEDIQRNFSKYEFEEQNGSTYCRITTDDINKVAPWLRTLYPDVEVIDDSEGVLRQKICKDLQEGLLLYGCI